jgi:hypothetical protein
MTGFKTALGIDGNWQESMGTMPFAKEDRNGF